MNSLYEYHLKGRTIVRVNWLQLFKQWEFSGNIIEISTTLKDLYPKNSFLIEYELLNFICCQLLVQRVNNCYPILIHDT